MSFWKRTTHSLIIHQAIAVLHFNRREDSGLIYPFKGVGIKSLNCKIEMIEKWLNHAIPIDFTLVRFILDG